MAKSSGDILELIKSRKTTYEYSEKMIPKKHLQQILEAGRWAPSSINTQTWSFVVVRNKQRIETLINSCFYGAFYMMPPVAIAIVLEPISKEQMMLLRGNAAELTKYHLQLNLSFPVANMVLEAHSLGIDTCILSPLKESANKIIGVKPPRNVLLVVGLGYEKKGAYRKKRERKSLKELVFSEVYGKR